MENYLNALNLLCPEEGKLIITKEIEDGEEFNIYTAKIFDEELDIYDCDFNGDGTVVINVENFNNIVLGVDHLKKLISLIKKVDKLVEKEDNTNETLTNENFN